MCYVNDIRFPELQELLKGTRLVPTTMRNHSKYNAVHVPATHLLTDLYTTNTQYISFSTFQALAQVVELVHRTMVTQHRWHEHSHSIREYYPKSSNHFSSLQWWYNTRPRWKAVLTSLLLSAFNMWQNSLDCTSLHTNPMYSLHMVPCDG